MPRIDQATEETAVDIVALTERVAGSIEAAFKYLKSIGDLLPQNDSRGQGFRVVVRACRRTAVTRLFTGNNYVEVAKKLGISKETVRNDVRDYYRKVKN